MSNTIPHFFRSCRGSMPGKPVRPEQNLHSEVQPEMAHNAVYSLLRSLPPRYAEVLIRFYGLPFEPEHLTQLPWCTSPTDRKDPVEVMQLGKVMNIGKQSALQHLRNARDMIKNSLHPHRSAYLRLLRCAPCQTEEFTPYTARSYWDTVPIAQTAIGLKEQLFKRLEEHGIYTVADLLNTERINRLVIEEAITQAHLRTIQSVLNDLHIPEHLIPFHFKHSEKRGLTTVSYYVRKAPHPLDRARADQHALRYLNPKIGDVPPPVATEELHRLVSTPWYLCKLQKLAGVTQEPRRYDSEIIVRAVQHLLRSLPSNLARSVSTRYALGFTEVNNNDGLLMFTPDPRSIRANELTLDEVVRFYDITNNRPRLGQHLQSALESIRQRADHPMRQLFWQIVRGEDVNQTVLPDSPYEEIAVSELPSVRSSTRVANALDEIGIFTVQQALEMSLDDAACCTSNSIGTEALNNLLTDIVMITEGELSDARFITEMTTLKTNLANRLCAIRRSQRSDPVDNVTATVACNS